MNPPPAEIPPKLGKIQKSKNRDFDPFSKEIGNSEAGFGILVKN